jgi:hypothetical protein
MDSSADRERIPFRAALLALVASALLRTIWFSLVLIMPRTTTGVLLFYLVLASAGVVLLHWCLSWFGWTLSLRAALGARALPGLAAAAVAAVIGFHASLPAVLGLVGVEFLLGAWIVRAAAVRPEGWVEEPDPSRADSFDLDAEDRYESDIASLVRSARAARAG